MKNARTGFTLLELLLAMALMSMLAATLYASLHIAFRARDSVDRVSDTDRAGQLALDMMCRDLSEALPPGGRLAGPFTGTNNQSGSPTATTNTTGTGVVSSTAMGSTAGVSSSSACNDISFYAAAHTPNDTPPEGDVCLLEYALSGGDNGNASLVRFTTTNLLAPQTPTPTNEVLCRNVQDLAFRFFDGTDWLDSWDSTQENNQPPVAVEITLTLQPSTGNSKTAAASTGSAGSSAPTDGGRVLTRLVMLPCANSQQDVTPTSTSGSGGQ